MTVLSVENPYSGEVISEIELMGKDLALQKIADAHAVHLQQPKGLPKHQRISILENFIVLLKEHRTELVQLSVSEGGKPLSDSEVEMDRAINGVKLGIQSVHNIGGKEIPMGLTPSSNNHLAYTMQLPIGVVLSVSAFNHPINLAIHQIIPAVAAGCPVLYKPALTTPLVSSRMVELIYEAGLPKEWCTYLVCDNETTSVLTQDSRLGYVSFIGSSKVGWEIKSNLAPGVHIALEHGGTAPIIVAEDASLNKAVPAIAKAGFYHAGQVCVSAQRVYVHSSILDTFIALLNSAAQQQKVGDSAQSSTDVGPLISAEALNRISAWVQEALNEGATLICGGNSLKNRCFEPTVLLNPSKESKVSQEEVFGPVICVYGFDTDEEAIALANESPFVFQSAAYTSSLERAMRFSEELNGAAVMINEHTAFRVDWMPFGGQAESGIGVGGIDYSTQEMLKEKLVVIKK
jgi:acyl-CoA reductase-like NAD-dependent aldehyde dehydrogenase